MDLITSESKHFATESTYPPKEDGILRVYSMNLCPYAERARIILLAKKLRHEIVNIDLKQKPLWYLKLNPQAKVPALDIGSEILVESLDICDYLDEAYPEPPLYPQDPQAKARDKELIKKFDNVIGEYYAAVRSIQNKSLAEYAEALLSLLEEYENELSTRGTFFGGKEPGMVDYMIWPWAERAGVIDLTYGQKIPIPENKISRIRTWCESMKKLDAIKATIISKERHYNMMKLYVSGEPIDYDSL
ncbi:GstO2 [Trypoxylus dichotomus]